MQNNLTTIWPVQCAVYFSILNHLGMTHECDRRRDRQTDILIPKVALTTLWADDILQLTIIDRDYCLVLQQFTNLSWSFSVVMIIHSDAFNTQTEPPRQSSFILYISIAIQYNTIQYNTGIFIDPCTSRLVAHYKEMTTMMTRITITIIIMIIIITVTVLEAQSVYWL